MLNQGRILVAYNWYTHFIEKENTGYCEKKKVNGQGFPTQVKTKKKKTEYVNLKIITEYKLSSTKLKVYIWFQLTFITKAVQKKAINLKVEKNNRK